MVIGNLFLILIGVIWIIFAVVQDMKKREIANWLNFSLILFALMFRFFYCLYENNGESYNFFYQGLIGFGVFFVIGNLLYYGKVFAGGDAKLMIALGAVIPLSQNLVINIGLALIFIMLFLLIGAFYGICFSLYLGIKNKRAFAKEFLRQFKKNKKIIYFSLTLAIILILLSSFEKIFFFAALLVFISPYFYIAAKAIDESCMIKKVNPKNLTEGDWLYKDVTVNGKVIKAKWEGLNEEEIKILKRTKKVILIRQGIPFSPVFLISYLLLIYIFVAQKWNIFYF